MKCMVSADKYVISSRDDVKCKVCVENNALSQGCQTDVALVKMNLTLLHEAITQRKERSLSFSFSFVY